MVINEVKKFVQLSSQIKDRVYENSIDKLYAGKGALSLNFRRKHSKNGVL